MFTHELTNRTAAFLHEIGLNVESGPVTDTTFLPGIAIVSGRMIVQESQLLSPGDILHEAGHLALIAPANRSLQEAVFEDPEIDLIEVAAISWSYAAALTIGMPLHVLFHPDGYRGNSLGLIFSFQNGISPGLPLLEKFEMAFSPQTAKLRGVQPFPHMERWLR
ncbi:MAG: hypothetical protein K1Y36_07285 [Blastocatellia bacterium]|nr:hypothetical protein [Blastocatellia bacterium]